MNISPLVSVKNLHVGYGHRTVAMIPDFELHAGGLLAVLGVNGSGKTTLIKTLAGFLAPLSGSIECLGRSLSGMSVRDRARAVSYVPQVAQVAWPYSVREIVQASRYSRTGAFGKVTSADLSAVGNALASMGLESLADRPFFSLSGGEARRVLVARALAQDTPLILLDEPAAHLDPGRQIELMQSLSGLSGSGKGIIVSLHDVNLARRYAKTVLLVMPDGTSVLGKTEDVLIGERLEAAYNTSFLFGDHKEYGSYVLPLAPLTVEKWSGTRTSCQDSQDVQDIQDAQDGNPLQSLDGKPVQGTGAGNPEEKYR